ncbi:venom serine carboxypeptidase-like [Macrosteles quadrilineatus]|uniref:venom serine carboxypeptidase-like n=1 Tax=Macrosteles quadrilineatus TaxID=74068 RepID=UPI0023E0AE02|nr:venom serine carboxypeptidase-like [Macrosteles quadrilineatus]
MLPLVILLSSLVSSCVANFRPITGPTLPVNENEILEDPLFLTPLLKKGKYKKAQQLSRVDPDIGNITSYSGFFTVNENCDSNLFFWFFPAQKDKWEEVPLVLWLQGGPGSTSMYGLFEELGPFESYKEGLRKRKYSWNVENNLLFIDQPVGVGYSFTGKHCYPHNETAVGADLYEAVVQFHQLFPNFQKNKFFITGESYAGHYIPALGHAIHKNNPTAKVKVNLTTMMIGDGWVDPISQVDYGSYLYQLGFIDDAEKGIYKNYQEQFVKQVTAKKWEKASTTCDAFTGDLYNRFVGDDVSVYNFLPQPSTEQQNWQTFIQSSQVRNALHVGKLKFQWGNQVYKSLKYDIVQSVKPWVEELLEVYPIVFYNGEVDIICAYPMTINLLRNLTWSGEGQYLNATRTQWCVDQELAGYYKGSHHLYDVLVRAAGHMVPADQSYWAYVLVNSVTSGTQDDPLYALASCDSKL